MDLGFAATPRVTSPQGHDFGFGKCHTFLMLSIGIALSIVGLEPAQVAVLAGEPGSRVTLMGQRGELDLSGDRPTLRFSVLARSLLPVDVDAIEIGVLFAAKQDALENVDPGRLYQSGGTAAKDVGVVRKRVNVSLRAHGEAAVTVDLPAAPGLPDPQVFQTHVLGLRAG